jgi:rubredoxin
LALGPRESFGKESRGLAGRSSRVKRGSEAGYNPLMRECPQCGESMRLSVRDVQDRDGTVRQVREWICPECDYFEEAETEG